MRLSMDIVPEDQFPCKKGLLLFFYLAYCSIGWMLGTDIEVLPNGHCISVWGHI